MDTKRQILDLDDVKLLVNTFYESVRADSVLSAIFNERIGENWPQHIEKMYKFWQTVLLKEHTYFGSPFTPHALLQVDHSHFEAWIALFTQTVDMLFTGEKAEEAKWRGAKMAEMFEYKNAYYRKNLSTPIL